MGSVISYTECPQCKGICISDFEYSTREEYHYCNSCGRNESWTLKRDKEGNVVTDEKGNIKREHELFIGHGCAKFAHVQGVAQIAAIKEELSDEELLAMFLEDLDKMEGVKREECYLTNWDPENNMLKVLYGKMPDTYEVHKRLSEVEERIDPEELREMISDYREILGLSNDDVTEIEDNRQLFVHICESVFSALEDMEIAFDDIDCSHYSKDENFIELQNVITSARNTFLYGSA